MGEPGSAVSAESGATSADERAYDRAMRYGQFCPIAKAAEIVAERWTPLVIAELLAGSTHFSDIRRGVPLMSQTLLSTRLKELERVGVVERRDPNAKRPQWQLTEAGRALAPVI